MPFSSFCSCTIHRNVGIHIPSTSTSTQNQLRNYDLQVEKTCSYSFSCCHLRQGLSLYHRLILNFWHSSYLSAGIIGMSPTTTLSMYSDFQVFFFFISCFGFASGLFWFLASETMFLCSPSQPGVHLIDQVGLDLTDTCLPLPLSARLKGVHQDTWH